MNFEEALAYLLSLGHETLTMKLGLRNTELLLGALGNPQKQFPAVQIAGTNGKGSTAVMLDSICRAAGIRAGLFTSPHLISITERIKINGEQISEADFAKFTSKVRATADGLIDKGQLDALPTFFEHITAVALLAFREANVELAILETGLGGRLDSTTAAGAAIVAITPIAFDHEEYLGHSLREIAAEKAAIIRSGVTAIVAPQDPVALEVILARCQSVGVTPRLVETRAADFEISLGLHGRHQITNAIVAIALAEALQEQGLNISHAAIISGIESARHPGRLEVWEGRPSILFDGAHNPAAAIALRDYLAEFVKQPVTMIFGAMRDKDLGEMASSLFPQAETLILVQLDNPRAASLDLLAQSVPDGCDKSKVRLADSLSQALDSAFEQTSAGGLICVTGSLYLVGAAQEALKNRKVSFAHQPA